MKESDTRRCETCGFDLPRGIPPGLCPNCALDSTQDVNSDTLLPLFSEGELLPRDFGDYELLSEIARGGMGIVYKARQKSLERTVAVKMLLTGTFSHAEMVRRFRGEAVLAGGLHHPNIVPVHEVGTRDGQHFIVMDFVDGMNLSVVLRTEPISIRDTARIVQTIASAVHYAHEQNVLHRDLKPSNILLDRNGDPHVGDFGLARKIDGDSTITLTGQVLGSPNYMPPEQAASNRGKVSRRSDVYGLGAILYHCLAGRPPFQAETLEATLQLVLTADPISPRLLNPSVPPDLETICLKCLEKEQGRRYTTAQELADELTRFLENQPIHARRITRLEKMARWCRRNPPLAVAVGAAALFFITGFVVSAWQAGRAHREALSSRLNLYLADISLAQQALRQNNYAAARQKLLAHLPTNGWPDLRGWEWRYLWQQSEPDKVPTFDAGDIVHDLALSPDGSTLVSARRDGQVRIMDFLRQTVTTNMAAGARDKASESLAFSPDGVWLATTDQDRVILLRKDNWERREFVSKSPGILHSIKFAPDGHQLFAASTRGLKAWDVNSGSETEPPVPFTNECLRLEISSDARWLALYTEDTLLAWDLASGSRVLSHAFERNDFHAIDLSSRGLLAACDRGGLVRVWDLAEARRTGATNSLAQWDTRAAGPNYAVSFSYDGSMLAVGGSAQLVHLYETTNWQELVSFKGHQQEVWALTFSRDNARLVSAGKDGSIKIWDPGARPVTNSVGRMFPLGFTPDSKFVVIFNEKREVQFWDATSRKLDRTFRPAGNAAAIKPVFQEITMDGSTLVVKESNNSIHILDLKTGESRGSLKLPKPEALEGATPWQCSPDSRSVAVGTKRMNGASAVFATEVYDLKTGEMAKSCADLIEARFSFTGRYLGGRNAASKPVIWDLQTGRTRVLEGLASVKCVTFSHDEKICAASSDNSRIQLWNMSDGQPRGVLIGHRAGVGDIAFSKDDRTIFSTSTDLTLRLWNVATRQEMIMFAEDRDTYELALSPDDTTLAVGGVDIRPRPVKLFYAPRLEDIDKSLGIGAR